MNAATRLPSLAEHLDGRDRGEGFEEFIAALSAQNVPDIPVEQAKLRIVRTMGIALVEATRIERTNGQSAAQTFELIARLTGHLLFANIYAGAIEGAPTKPLARGLKAWLAEGVDEAASFQKLRNTAACEAKA